MTARTNARRLTMLGAALALAAAIVAVAIVVSQSGTTDKVSDTERASLFAGIPQSGEWLGARGAPVVVEEYADLQCPFCADFALRHLPAIVRDYVRPGSVRMQMRLLAFLGPDSVEGARVAAAMGLENRQWDFVEGFYAAQGEENSGYVSEEFLRDAGASDRALAAQDDPRVAEQLEAAHHAAVMAGVESTPTFRVGRRDGAMQVVSADGLRAAIDAALAG